MNPTTDSEHIYNRTALFLISVLALFTAATAFSLRIAVSGAIKEALYDPVDMANSGRMIGDALGAAFLGFAASLLIISPILDLLGAKRVLLIASLTFIAGPLLLILAPHLATGAGVVPIVWWSMLIMGIGWGCTEAAINPVTAILYPDDKTHRMNILHAWWPAGIVVGGLTSLLIIQVLNLDWRVAIALITVPATVFGAWALTQNFPKTQADSLNVGFTAMLMVIIKQPLFWVFFGIMFLTASTELAPSSWVDIALSKTVKMPGIVVLIYVAAIMFVMRHFAGALAHRISDIGLLWISTVPAGVGLYLLSIAHSPFTALVAATVWAIGVCYMWPTMLAAVAHRFPRGGSWTIGLIGFAGALAIRFVLPELGGIYDQAKVEHAGGPEAFAVLPEGSQGMADALAHAASTSFQTVAVIPAMLFVIFAGLWFYERRKNDGQS
jgi:MFS family permease